MKDRNEYLIVILLYNGVDLLDIAAPKEIFGWVTNAKDGRKLKIRTVAAKKNMIKTRDGLRIKPDHKFKNKKVRRPDLVWIPGGAPEALAKIISKPRSSFFKYLLKVAKKAEYLCSVCEGAILFAESGLLDGHKATTHWKFYPCFDKYKKVKLVEDYPPYVKSGNRITGGGISSGLDEAYYITTLIAGEDAAKEAALIMQYNPQPFYQIHIPGSDCCPVSGFKNTCPE